MRVVNNFSFNFVILLSCVSEDYDFSTKNYNLTASDLIALLGIVQTFLMLFVSFESNLFENSFVKRFKSAFFFYGKTETHF